MVAEVVSVQVCNSVPIVAQSLVSNHDQTFSASSEEYLHSKIHRLPLRLLQHLLSCDRSTITISTFVHNKDGVILTSLFCLLAARLTSDQKYYCTTVADPWFVP